MNYIIYSCLKCIIPWYTIKILMVYIKKNKLFGSLRAQLDKGFTTGVFHAGYLWFGSLPIVDFYTAIEIVIQRPWPNLILRYCSRIIYKPFEFCSQTLPQMVGIVLWFSSSLKLLGYRWYILCPLMYFWWFKASWAFGLGNVGVFHQIIMAETN